MDTLNTYRQAVEQVLLPYTKIPYAHGRLECEAVFDRENDRYVLLTQGWEGKKRVHGCLVHVEIINGKIWIQRDGTEQGIATELVQAGIPKSAIVLGFHSLEMRKYSEYATA